MLQVLKPTGLEPALHSKGRHRSEKPMHHREAPTHHDKRSPAQAKINKQIKLKKDITLKKPKQSTPTADHERVRLFII